MNWFQVFSKKRPAAQGFQPNKASQKPPLQTFILEPILTPSGLVDDPTPDPAWLDLDTPDLTQVGVPDSDLDLPDDSHAPHPLTDEVGINSISDADLSNHTLVDSTPEPDLEPVSWIYNDDAASNHVDEMHPLAADNSTDAEPVLSVDAGAIAVDIPNDEIEPVSFIHTLEPLADEPGIGAELTAIAHPNPTFESGVFTVGETGEVTIDYLFDGGGYRGELAIFSLDGMGEFEPGSPEFIQEAAHRALSDSNLGYVIISDKTEGARFGETILGESQNWNSGEYQGLKTFSMRSGDEFGVMLIPNGKVQQLFDNPNASGAVRPLFSMVTANPNQAFHVGQIADVTGEGNTFVMEDMRVDGWTDRDYNDIVFQVRGATGKAALLDDVINPTKDWRSTDMGQALIAYAEAYVTPDADDAGAISIDPITDIATNPLEGAGAIANGPVDNAGVIATGPIDDNSDIPTDPVDDVEAITTGPIDDNSDITPELVENEGAIATDLISDNSEITTEPVEDKTALATGPINDNSDITPELVQDGGAIANDIVEDETAIATGSIADNSGITTEPANDIEAIATDPAANQPNDVEEGDALATKPITDVEGIAENQTNEVTQDNSIGIEGANNNAPLLVNHVDSSNQWTETLIELVDTAKASTQQNAVVNLSFDLTQVNPDGSTTTRYEFTPSEQSALAYAQRNNVLLVVSAGDHPGEMSALGKASLKFDNIITVGAAERVNNSVALSKAFGLAKYSGSGASLDVLADGSSGEIVGTAVATAKVTGAVSQVWAANPELNYTQVIDIIKRTATDLGKPNWDADTGAGLLNIAAAVHLAKATQPKLLPVKPLPIDPPKDEELEVQESVIKITPEMGFLPEPIKLTDDIWFLGGPSPDKLNLLGGFSNRNAADTTNADQLWSGGGLGLNLNGSGVTVGVWDGGKVRNTHQEFGSRVVISDSASSFSAHATHVAGTIGATGVNSEARGMANQVNIRSYDWDKDLQELEAAAKTGLTLSNHSYGSFIGWDSRWDWSGIGVYGAIDTWWGDRARFSEAEGFGKYSPESKELDQILYNNPNLLSVWASGNERGNSFGNQSGNNTYITYLSSNPGNIPNWPKPGWYRVPNSGITTAPGKDGGNTGYDTLSSKGAVAKNTLVVGAINAITADPYNSSNVVMSSFSSWGATDDGRLKVDVVGNGVGVYSTLASSNNAYASYSGTSMATPNVTGTAALLTEHYKNLYGVSPRSATLKGVITHTAFDAGNKGPDYTYGWGVVDGAAAATFLTNAKNQVTDRLIESTYTGSQQSYQITSNGSGSIKATLVWTDPPGTPHGNGLDEKTRVLVNDLDLSITAPNGQVFYPWTLDPNNPSAPAVRTTRNNVDNIEQVLIDTPMAGTYTINVNHSGNSFTQAYSLLVSGISKPLYNPIETAINNEYQLFKHNLGNPAGSIANAHASPQGTTGKWMNYQNGSIHWTQKYGAVAVWIDLNREYTEQLGSAGWLGFPTKHQYDWNGGARTDFEGGYIYWDGKRAKAYRFGEFPNSSIETAINNEYQLYKHNLGNATGPIVDATPSPQGTTGKWIGYQGGTIHWTPQYGAVAVWIDLQREYKEKGGSGGWLGFPTKHQYNWNGGARTDFEGGYIYWDGKRAKAYRFGEMP